MTRAERRRMEREIEQTKRAPGTGEGWRLNRRGRRYPVKEPPPFDMEAAIAESDAVAEALRL